MWQIGTVIGMLIPICGLMKLKNRFSIIVSRKMSFILHTRTLLSISTLLTYAKSTMNKSLRRLSWGHGLNKHEKISPNYVFRLRMIQKVVKAVEFLLLMITLKHSRK